VYGSRGTGAYRGYSRSCAIGLPPDDVARKARRGCQNRALECSRGQIPYFEGTACCDGPPIRTRLVECLALTPGTCSVSSGAYTSTSAVERSRQASSAGIVPGAHVTVPRYPYRYCRSRRRTFGMSNRRARTGPLWARVRQHPSKACRRRLRTCKTQPERRLRARGRQSSTLTRWTTIARSIQ
jgi:hypothetical protein